eukprot:gene10381-794_t
MLEFINHLTGDRFADLVSVKEFPWMRTGGLKDDISTINAHITSKGKDPQSSVIFIFLPYSAAVVPLDGGWAFVDSHGDRRISESSDFAYIPFRTRLEALSHMEDVASTLGKDRLSVVVLSKAQPKESEGRSCLVGPKVASCTAGRLRSDGVWSAALRHFNTLPVTEPSKQCDKDAEIAAAMARKRKKTLSDGKLDAFVVDTPELRRRKEEAEEQATNWVQEACTSLKERLDALPPGVRRAARAAAVKELKRAADALEEEMKDPPLPQRVGKRRKQGGVHGDYSEYGVTVKDGVAECAVCGCTFQALKDSDVIDHIVNNKHDSNLRKKCLTHKYYFAPGIALRDAQRADKGKRTYVTGRTQEEKEQKAKEAHKSATSWHDLREEWFHSEEQMRLRPALTKKGSAALDGREMMEPLERKQYLISTLLQTCLASNITIRATSAIVGWLHQIGQRGYMKDYGMIPDAKILQNDHLKPVLDEQVRNLRAWVKYYAAQGLPVTIIIDEGLDNKAAAMDECCPYNVIVIAGPRVMYCDSVFPAGDTGADVAQVTKAFVNDWLGEDLRGCVTGWMTDNEHSNDTAWRLIVKEKLLPNA